MKWFNSLVLWLCFVSISPAACCCCGCKPLQKHQLVHVVTLPANETEAGWTMKFEISKDEKGEWRWHTKSRNGRITGDSGEGYKNKADLLKSILLFKNFASQAEILEK